MGYKTRLFLALWIPAFAGVLSFLLVDIHALIAMLQLPPGEAELPPPALLKLATVAQPTVLITIAALIGCFLAEKVGLHAPAAEAWARRESFLPKLKPQIIPGILAGVLSGISIVAIWMAFTPFLTADFIERAEGLNRLMPAAVRFLYGGFTEEVLLRWGMMSFLAWLFWLMFQKGNGHPNAVLFIAAILISTLLFAAGHLPLAYALAGQMTVRLVAFVLVSNSIFGIVAGLLYWKKGLETAVIAHIFTHVILLTAITVGV